MTKIAQPVRRTDKSDAEKALTFRAAIEHGRHSGVGTHSLNQIIAEAKSKIPQQQK